ncbi:MAG TPA: flippase-like domain-containing protein [Acidiferrobacteraceae bacterium]|nr:flippase-like domain-containing protein [Acidiferrobacteraceae bacterium]
MRYTIMAANIKMPMNPCLEPRVLQQHTDSNASKSRWRIWVLALLISLILLAILVSQADIDYLWTLWAGVQPVYLVVGVLAVSLDCLVTGLRLRLLHLGAGKRPRVVYVKIEMLHGFLLLLLPARLGELPYMLMLRRRLSMDHGEVFANFVYQRLLDAMVLALFFLSSVVLIVGDNEGVTTWVPIVLVVCVLFVLIFQRVEWIAAVTLRVMHRLHVRGSKFSRWLLKVLSTARRWSRRLRLEGVRWQALAWTGLRWSAVMILTWAAFSMFGIRFGMAEVLFLGAGLSFLTVIPLQTVGGFGISEVGLAGLLVIIGHPWQEAAATALLVRIAYVVMTLMGLALAGVVIMLIRNRSEDARKGTFGVDSMR